MKKMIYGIASAVLAAPLVVLTVVNAQESGTSTTPKRSTTAQQTQTAPTDSSTQTKVAQTAPKTELTAQQKTELQQRLAKRKADMKVKITNAEKTRLQARCKNGQGVLSSLQGRIKGTETSRDQVYENLVTRLTKLGEKLKAKSVDTTDLDAQIIALQERIVTFETNLAVYKETVSDLALMDCASDPEAFKASLETARAAKDKVSLDVSGIRTYVKETIKPTLSSLRSQLAEIKPTEGDN